MPLTRPGHGPTFGYAGQPVAVLAGADGVPAGFAAAEMVVPPRFRGPVPHVHDGFDEGLYVLSGTLLVTSGREEAQEAPPGSLFVAPRGQRHTFANPSDEPVRVLGLWSPGGAGLALVRDVGAALPADGPPDPALLAEVYARHASRLDP